MGSVILIFAFTMSLIIDFVERKMNPQDKVETKRKIKENNVVTEPE